MYSVKELQELIDAEIKKLSNGLHQQKPSDLYLPVNYSIEMGGKRLRPVLLLLGYNLFSDHIENAVPAALAIEIFHNFTLLHDDIMDKAEVRRNRPTVHKKFNENGAILSGDVMAFLSYRLLYECKSEKLQNAIQLFTQTAIEVCEGQQYDMDFENRLDVSEAEYLEMIRLKTAVLLACGLKAGALLANSDENVANQLYDFGINIGLAFQLQDDFLDTFGNQETFGKKIGGDIISNKKTFLLIKALENAPSALKSELLGWIANHNCSGDEKIDAVTNIFNQLEIKNITQEKIDFYFLEATRIFDQILIEESRKSILLEISNSMFKRVK